MRHLILDYYRRWSLVLAIGAAVHLLQGWFIAAADPKFPIDSAMPIAALWVGAMLFMFDISRGVVRVVATLPLTANQIGRSWWLATVPIPALVLSMLLFLGAAASVFWHASQPFPFNRLALASLFIVLWLGTGFALFLPVSQKANRGWPLLRSTFFAIFTVLVTLWMVFGFFFSRDATKNPAKLATFLAGGAIMTVVGWLRAGRFDPAAFCGRKNMIGAGFPRLTPWLTPPLTPPSGFGGIPYLLRTTFVNAVLLGLVGVIFVALILAWRGQTIWRGLFNLHEGIETIGPVSTIIWMPIVFRIRPLLTQLRVLRTLPLSAAMLVSTIFAAVILPILAIGLVIASLAGLSLGTPAALVMLKSCIFTLAPAALCTFFALWRGNGIQVDAFLTVTMIVWAIVIVFVQNISFSLAGLGALGGLALSWLLSFRVLLRGNRQPGLTIIL